MSFRKLIVLAASAALCVGMLQGCESRKKQDQPNDLAFRQAIEAMIEDGSKAGASAEYADLIAGRKQIIVAARRPTSEELKRALDKGLELDVRPFAMDALVVYCRNDVPLQDLTAQKLRDIYSGKNTDGGPLGRPGQKITAYQADPNSVAFQAMARLLMQGQKMAPAAPMADADAMFRAVQAEKDSLGYGLYSCKPDTARCPNVVACAIDGVTPDAQSVRARRYPYLVELYAVTVLGQDDAGARVRDWALSGDGQAAVYEMGYAPIR